MQPDSATPRSNLHLPRIVVASGMSGTGVSTVATVMQQATPALNIVDAGARWTDILEACTPGFARFILVTTHDIISVSSTYALVKMVRDRFPDAPMEVLVNFSEAREALKTYERVQMAASHFLQETIGYAGAIPEDTTLVDVAVTLHDIAVRLEEEIGSRARSAAFGAAQRRNIL